VNGKRGSRRGSADRSCQTRPHRALNGEIEMRVIHTMMMFLPPILEVTLLERNANGLLTTAVSLNP